MEDIIMDLEYLRELDYSTEEIEEYSQNWNDSIIRFLAENKDIVLENMKYLCPFFNKELILKFPVFYTDSFTISPKLFKERIDLFRKSFPDNWINIIEKQFWGYDGICGSNYRPFLRVLGSYIDSDINDAIHQLKNPGTITFEFIVLLKKEVGIELSADCFFEEWLLEIEMSKYEVLRNAKYLLDKGLSRKVVEDLLTQTPFLMMLSELEVNKRLVDGFGENYIETMQETDLDIFMEILEEIGW